MSLRSNATRLTAVTRELSNHWQETKSYWKDDRAGQFEHKYLDELFATVERTTTIIEQLDKLLTKIKNDCE